MTIEEYLKKENERLSKQNEFLMKKDNVLQSLKQWLNDENKKTQIYADFTFSKVLSKIEELEGE